MRRGQAEDTGAQGTGAEGRTFRPRGGTRGARPEEGPLPAPAGGRRGLGWEGDEEEAEEEPRPRAGRRFGRETAEPLQSLCGAAGPSFRL